MRGTARRKTAACRCGCVGTGLSSLTSTPHGKGIYLQHRNPGWLDGAKMRELGFDTAPATKPATFDSRAPRHVALPRDVFVVLEFDGPAYQEFLRRVGVAAQDSGAAGTPPAQARDARAELEEALRATPACSRSTRASTTASCVPAMPTARCTPSCAGASARGATRSTTTRAASSTSSRSTRSTCRSNCVRSSTASNGRRTTTATGPTCTSRPP